MTETPRVIAVCGSRREGSYTRSALHYALDAAAAAGAETDFLDLGDPELELPLYHPDWDAEGTGDVAAALERVRRADGVLLGSPVYHGSYSSTFRSFHDWCSFDEYEDTVVGLVATAGGGSFGSTLDHMRITIRGVHGWVHPKQVGIRNAYEKFAEREAATADGEIGAAAAHELTDGDIADRLGELGEGVAESAVRLGSSE
ncbi:NADPH-dependent FMN reductase [Halobaculum sp. MBLA0147]|uniref:NADPH-dependent FMN reductase n=1 Tax=Halobaculum sp. MBLA0147 TaxID=3079934 RepID=UPI0035237DC2